MKFSKPWQRVAVVLGGLAVFEIGARIVAPGLNVDALTNYLRNGGGNWLLSLYSQLGGGGLVRGGVLMFGILPYVSATIFVRLARAVAPAISSRWARALTVGLAAIQGVGFARFVQGIPGAVAHPGIGFVLQTALVLTTGSVVAMVVAEQIGRAVSDDDEGADDELAKPQAVHELPAPAPEVCATGVRGEELKVR